MRYQLIKVKNEDAPSGFTRIREDDFDPEVHVRFDAAPESAPDECEAEDCCEGEKAVLHDRGNGYWDVLVDGEPVNEKALREDAAREMCEDLNG